MENDIVSEVADSEAPMLVGEFRLSISDIVAAIVVAATLAPLYLWRLLPGIGSSGDTIKFQFVGATGGTVHATGYPVYVAFTWVASRVPLGDVAIRANAMSAVFAGLACVIGYFIMRELGVRIVIAGVFAVAMGLIPVTFFFSVVAEVYTLHIALVLGMVLVLLVWQRLRSDRLLYLLMALVAVSFGNHMTTVLIVPSILYFLWKVDREKAFSAKMAAVATVAAVLSALQYGFVLWSVSNESSFYLEIVPESVADVVNVMLGGRFRGDVFALGIDKIVSERIPLFVSMVVASFLVVIPLVVLGFRALRGSAGGVLLASWTTIVLLFSITYRISDPEPYLIPVMFVLSILGAVGAEYVRQRWITRPVVAGVALFSLLIAMSVPVQSAANTNWSNTEEYVADMREWLTTLPSNSLLALRARETNAAWNLISIGGVESDVAVLLVEADERRGGHFDVLDDYMRGLDVPRPRAGGAVEPGRAVYAGTDKWMCLLVREGFALVETQPRLYRVVSLRGQLPLPARWTDEMRTTCIDIDEIYADLTS